VSIVDKLLAAVLCLSVAILNVEVADVNKRGCWTEAVERGVLRQCVHSVSQLQPFCSVNRETLETFRIPIWRFLMRMHISRLNRAYVMPTVTHQKVQVCCLHLHAALWNILAFQKDEIYHRSDTLYCNILSSCVSFNSSCGNAVIMLSVFHLSHSISLEASGLLDAGRRLVFGSGRVATAVVVDSMRTRAAAVR
jgi:hypothetical protein